MNNEVFYRYTVVTLFHGNSYFRFKFKKIVYYSSLHYFMCECGGGFTGVHCPLILGRGGLCTICSACVSIIQKLKNILKYQMWLWNATFWNKVFNIFADTSLGKWGAWCHVFDTKLAVSAHKYDYPRCLFFLSTLKL